MQPKKLLTILLIVFVIGSVVYMIAKEKNLKSAVSQANSMPAEENTIQPEQTPISPVNSSDANAVQKTELIVYYFHGDMRCPTCHKLENYAKEAIETFFAGELSEGQIIWKPVNIDKPENSHFVDDYKLVTKAVILSEQIQGKETRWKNLDLIWEKVGDKNEYLKYISQGISKFLEGEKSE